jgi:hypothetical protein
MHFLNISLNRFVKEFRKNNKFAGINFVRYIEVDKFNIEDMTYEIGIYFSRELK